MSLFEYVDRLMSWSFIILSVDRSVESYFSNIISRLIIIIVYLEHRKGVLYKINDQLFSEQLKGLSTLKK